MLNSFPQGDETAIHDEAVVPVGTCVVDAQDDREWVYLRAYEALVRGNPVAPALNIVAVANQGAVAAGTDELTLLASAVSSAELVILNRAPDNPQNGEMLEFIIAGGTGVDQAAIVTSKNGRQLNVQWDSDDGTLTTALDGTSDIEIFATWWAQKSNDALPTIAIAQQAIAVDKYFWGLRKGRGVGLNSDAAVTGRGIPLGLDTSSDAGEMVALAATQTEAAVAYSLAPASADALVQIVANINTPISQVLHRKSRYIPGYNRPS